ncbi:MAG: hypothetical protein IJ398_01635 [Clostridia bacterium]|nr:hypothetical protein [Clostridia bacterium]
MFTRYKGIDIPKNYSGNRFRVPIETEMKTHSGEIISASRTSVSPSFNNGISSFQDNEVENEGKNIDFEATEQNSDYGQEEPYSSDLKEGGYENPDKYSEPYDFEENNYDDENRAQTNQEIDESPSPVCDISDNNEKQGSNFFKELSSVFNKLFSNSKSDDMLLLFIALLLANDKNENNSDAVILLLLVLLYR